MAEQTQSNNEKLSMGCWNPADYIDKRVQQYQDWYDAKSITAKRNYMGMRTTIVLGGIIIPALANTHVPGKDIAISIISFLVASFAALESVYHYREQWKNYRSTEQFLSKEKVLFLTGEGVYKSIKSSRIAFVQFVERCENAIDSENSSTLNIMTLAPQEKKTSQPDNDHETPSA